MVILLYLFKIMIPFGANDAFLALSTNLIIKSSFFSHIKKNH